MTQDQSPYDQNAEENYKNGVRFKVSSRASATHRAFDLTFCLKRSAFLTTRKRSAHFGVSRLLHRVSPPRSNALVQAALMPRFANVSNGPRLHRDPECGDQA